MKPRHVVAAAWTAAVALGFVSLVSAQSGSFDHLECYAIKDTLARGTARADVVPGVPPFVAGLGCKITLPAREYCTRTAKENLQPPPAATVGGDEPGDYSCYKLACPRTADLQGGAMQSTDQFGQRTVFVKKPQRLCVPANRTTPTPATPTGNTPTPTAPVATVTPGAHDPGCSFDGTECHGSCNTTGRCVWYPTESRCICPALFDADCNHSIVSCGGGLCFGPNQVCRPNPNPTAWPLCGCVSPTPVPTP